MCQVPWKSAKNCTSSNLKKVWRHIDRQTKQSLILATSQQWSQHNDVDKKSMNVTFLLAMPDHHRLLSQNGIYTLMHVLVVITDALQDKCYHCDMTTKWRIYHHEDVISTMAWTFPQEPEIYTSWSFTTKKVMIEHVVTTELIWTNELRLDKDHRNN